MNTIRRWFADLERRHYRRTRKYNAEHHQPRPCVTTRQRSQH
ncbi:hypothetical protein [Phycicoccus sp. 3266]|nr:hypothetical protein [Phycicoccus sp. 3266]MDR6861951.1 hypothetical protein [Phycicoccus sp. 3266]